MTFSISEFQLLSSKTSVIMMYLFILTFIFCEKTKLTKLSTNKYDLMSRAASPIVDLKIYYDDEKIPLI